MTRSTTILSTEALALALRAARRRQGFTQKELARRSGIPQPNISDFERGVAAPSIPTLLRLVASLELDLVLREQDLEASVADLFAEQG